MAQNAVSHILEKIYAQGIQSWILFNVNLLFLGRNTEPMLGTFLIHLYFIYLADSSSSTLPLEIVWVYLISISVLSFLAHVSNLW